MRSPDPTSVRPRKPLHPRGVTGARFRVPPPRGRLLARDALVGQLVQAIVEHPLVLVVAAAGFGKSTLLAQAAARLPRDCRALWIAVDRLDRSPVRLFRTLVESINSLNAGVAPLDADTLTRMVQAGGDGAHSAAVEIADWLAEIDDGRLVWFWDDVHVLDSAPTWQWIDDFLDRLPPSVCCVMGAREAPPLALARRRARGLIAEFHESRLGFSADEASEFLARAAPHATPEQVRSLHARTRGWIAGLQLLASAPQAPGSAAGARVGPDDAPVFEYFAEEVMATLPAELARFVEDCCVLAEFDPARAAAIADEGDAGDRTDEHIGDPAAERIGERRGDRSGKRTAQAARSIDALLRRNLFVSVVDPSGPLVRLHDLFRDFLASRLQRLEPARWRALHRRAARIADDPIHSAHHAMLADDPESALRTLATAAPQLARRGHGEAIEAFLRRLPPELAAQSTDAHWIAGAAAYHRTAIDETRAHLLAAADGFARDGAAEASARSLVMAARATSYCGDLAGAQAMLARIDAERLTPGIRAELALEQAWIACATGNPAEAGAALRQATAIAEEQASPELCGLLVERMRTHFVATPGFAELARRFHDLAQRLEHRTDTPLFAHSTVLGVWSALWSGDVERARRLHDSLWVDVERWRAFRSLHVDLSMSRAYLATVAGEFREAATLMDEMIASSQSGTLGLRNAWIGTYLYMQLRVHWVAGETAQARQTYARMLTAWGEQEWPFMAFARRYADGMIAHLDGDYDRAATSFGELATAQSRFPVLKLAGDLRLAAARAELARGRREQASALAEAALVESADEGALGALLIESPELLRQLPALISAGHPRRGALAALVDRAIAVLDENRGDTGAAAAGARTPFDALTEREREVLALIARGASNKRIALDLNLSLHTVKRHVANIIGKLGVRSRGEAIARFLNAARG